MRELEDLSARGLEEVVRKTSEACGNVLVGANREADTESLFIYTTKWCNVSIMYACMAQHITGSDVTSKCRLKNLARRINSMHSTANHSSRQQIVFLAIEE